jgi:hypothetical protein
LKRILVALLLLAALIIPVTSAGAATPQEKQIKTLQKQVKALQKQVKTLNAGLNMTYSVAIVDLRATTCAMAMVADLFQSTWTALGTTTGAPFAPLLAPAVNDYSACSELGLTRQSGLSVPNWTAYNSLITYLYGP